MPVAAQPTSRPPTLQQSVEARLGQAGPGVRFGLVVATMDGRELVAVAPDARFIPASNTKLVTTAAAFATLTDLDRPDTAGGASVALETERGHAPDVLLEGFGDARLSSAPDCIANYLEKGLNGKKISKVGQLSRKGHEASWDYRGQHWQVIIEGDVQTIRVNIPGAE